SERWDQGPPPTETACGWYFGAQDDPDSKNGRWRPGAQDSLPSVGAARSRSAVLRRRLNRYLKARRKSARGSAMRSGR
ncbi:hypothetical protein CF326_g9195, partial [Tilletia indica]